MSVAATKLAVVPALKEHDICRAWIAISLATMAKAVVATVLINGSEVLHDCQTNADAGALAKNFLAEHHHSCNKDVPASFWHEFEIWADMVSIAPVSPPAKSAKKSGLPTRGQGSTHPSQGIAASSSSSSAKSSMSTPQKITVKQEPVQPAMQAKEVSPPSALKRVKKEFD